MAVLPISAPAPHLLRFRLTNCFSPVINIARDPRWGRLSESLGEDPYLTAELARVYVRWVLLYAGCAEPAVLNCLLCSRFALSSLTAGCCHASCLQAAFCPACRGLQGSDPHFLKAAATCKHFAACGWFVVHRSVLRLSATRADQLKGAVGLQAAPGGHCPAWRLHQVTPASAPIPCSSQTRWRSLKAFHGTPSMPKWMPGAVAHAMRQVLCYAPRSCCHLENAGQALLPPDYLPRRDVRDTYLAAWPACVKEAAAVMCSYNSIDGTPACASSWLQDHWRDGTGFG